MLTVDILRFVHGILHRAVPAVGVRVPLDLWTLLRIAGIVWLMCVCTADKGRT